MPKAISSLHAQRRARTIAVILSLSKIILSPYSRCLKKGLVYIMLANPFSQQLFFYLKCTKANIYSFYNVRSTFNAKYT